MDFQNCTFFRLLPTVNTQSPSLEIYVETQPKEEKVPKTAKEFLMTPQTIGGDSATIMSEKAENFKIRGQLDTTSFCIQDPLSGYSK